MLRVGLINWQVLGDQAGATLSAPRSPWWRHFLWVFLQGSSPIFLVLALLNTFFIIIILALEEGG